MMFHFGIISILPNLIEWMKHGMIRKAISLNKMQIDCWNPRDWADRPYCQVDDTPYGGGPGMVMRYEPVSAAIRFAKSRMPKETKVIYLSPQGKKITQSDLNEVVKTQRSILFVAGRYEGIDERIVEKHIDEEWSIGDFVLSGGELAAMVIMDGIARLIPGVLGHPESILADSFMTGYLDHPHYTKPEVVDGLTVPSVLLSGDHARIETWRKKQALGRTWLRRPDLLTISPLNEIEKALLEQFKSENDKPNPLEDLNDDKHH